MAMTPKSWSINGLATEFSIDRRTVARRLSQAGVPTELHVYPGVPHGFGMFADIPAARQMARDAEAWLARQFGIDLSEIASPY